MARAVSKHVGRERPTTIDRSQHARDDRDRPMPARSRRVPSAPRNADAEIERRRAPKLLRARWEVAKPSRSHRRAARAPKLRSPQGASSGVRGLSNKGQRPRVRSYRAKRLGCPKAPAHEAVRVSESSPPSPSHPRSFHSREAARNPALDPQAAATNSH